MQITLNLGRWTKLHTIIAVSVALVLGGAVERATAISPTVGVPIKWTGGVEIVHPDSVGVALAYTVPVGKSFMLTDLVLGNFGTTLSDVTIYTGGESGPTPCHTVATFRLEYIVIPPGGSTVVSLEQGLGFTAGQAVCVQTIHGTAQVNIRGFLFTPA